MTAPQRFNRDEDGVVLTVAVADADAAPVVAAAAAAGDDTGVLGALCEVIVGRPLIEAADHGVLGVIDRQRAEGRDFGVSGIVTVKAAGEPYLRARRLIRGILADYRAATGWAETGNAWTPVPAEDWRDKPGETRLADLSAATARYCAENGLDAGAIRPLTLDGGVRLTVEISAAVPISEQPRLLLALERALRGAVPARIEVFVAEMKDINQTRKH